MRKNLWNETPSSGKNTKAGRGKKHEHCDTEGRSEGTEGVSSRSKEGAEDLCNTACRTKNTEGATSKLREGAKGLSDIEDRAEGTKNKTSRSRVGIEVLCDTEGCARDTEVATSRSSESTEDRWGETPNSAEVQLQRNETPREREGTKDLRSKP